MPIRREGAEQEIRREPVPLPVLPPEANQRPVRSRLVAGSGWIVAACFAGLWWVERPSTPPLERDKVEAEVDAGEEHPEEARIEADAVPPVVAIRLGEFSLDIAAAARSMVKRSRPPPGFRDDCSGFVSAVLTAAGIPMDGNTAQLYAIAEEHGLLHHDPLPTIGDLVFFDNTHDRNENGVWDDWHTHIAVVVDVDPEGTITLAHRGSERALVQMNVLPEHIQQHEEGGRLFNSYLRRKSLSDGKWELNLTGELWRAFAHVAPDVDWVAD
jgi:hypothetical protein